MRTALIFLSTLMLAGLAQAGEVSVAVASNFAPAMRVLADDFENATGHRTGLAFGSSGRLYAQIRNGAPFEVFLSADQSKPEALVADGLAEPASRFTYATGTLVLYSTTPGRIEDGRTLLTSGDYDRLAIANPRLAPYGVAAIEVLDRLGAREAADDRLVQGENIAQAYQFTASGNAELGLVALSLLLEDGGLRRGSAWVVPADLHSPIRQDAVLLTRGAANPAATALLDYLRSERARALIERHGYAVTESP